MLKCIHPYAYATFFAFLLLGVGARLAIGEIYFAGEAIQLIEALANSGLYLGSAAATASATILALMLTVTGMIRRLDSDFDHSEWQRVNRVAELATISLIASLLLLLSLVFPLGESEKLPNGWYIALYNLVFSLTVLVIALIAATVVMLYITVRKVIAAITPSEDV